MTHASLESRLAGLKPRHRKKLQPDVEAVSAVLRPDEAVEYANRHFILLGEASGDGLVVITPDRIVVSMWKFAHGGPRAVSVGYGDVLGVSNKERDVLGLGLRSGAVLTVGCDAKDVRTSVIERVRTAGGAVL